MNGTGDVEPAGNGRIKVRLDSLVKHFPGQREAAVDELSM
jgi:hypothetical protein